MPLQVPDDTPHWPGVAAAGLSVATVFDHPSVHHGLPLAPIATRCGVLLLSGRTIGYSEIALVAVFSEAIRSTLLLFSVNQTRLPLAAIPYGLLFALGVGKSRTACVEGSKEPTAETRCSV